MDEVLLLINLTAFTVVAAACSIIFNKIKLPPLIGYLATGIILASVWTITEESELIIGILSDLGLVMMMFCIGIEINLKKLRKQGMFAITVGLVQLPLILIGGYAAGQLMGFGMVESLALGAIMSGSSTAVVLAVQRSQNLLDKDHREMVILVLIIEDIAQVVMLSILSPIMAGSSMDTNGLIVMIISIAVFMSASIFIGVRLVPAFINWVSDNVSDEVVLITALGFTFAMALLSMYVGLSMAIGAFLAGLMVSATRKSRDIRRNIQPMESVFMAMFFISVGMEITAPSLIENFTTSIMLYLIFAFLMMTGVFLGYMTANEGPKVSFLSAVSLTVMGEFAFIISKAALEYGVIEQSLYTAIVETALISMIALPIAAKFASRLYDGVAEKSPEPLKKIGHRFISARTRVYSSLHQATNKSRRAFRRSLTYAYIDIVLIVAIQIVFYFIVPPLAVWLTEAFGLTLRSWDFILMIVNFLVLFIPAHMLVSNAKILDEFVVSSSRFMSREKSGKSSARIYQSFIEFNTTLIAFVIVLIIIAIVPNPLGNWDHIPLFIAAALSIIVIYYFINRENRKKLSEPDEPEEVEEEVPEEVPEPLEEPHEYIISKVDVKEEGKNADDEIEVFIPEGRNDFRSRHLRQRVFQTSSDLSMTSSASRVFMIPSSTTMSP